MANHHLRIDYPDKTYSHDRIIKMYKSGLLVSRYGVLLHISAGWLDEHECYIDGYGKWLIRPYRKNYERIIWFLLQQKDPQRVEPHASQRSNYSSTV